MATNNLDSEGGSDARRAADFGGAVCETRIKTIRESYAMRKRGEQINGN